MTLYRDGDLSNFGPDISQPLGQDIDDYNASRCVLSSLDLIICDIQAMTFDIKAQSTRPTFQFLASNNLTNVVQHLRQQCHPPVEHIDNEYKPVITDRQVMRTIILPSVCTSVPTV